MIVVNQNGNLAVETNTVWYDDDSIYCISTKGKKFCMATYEDETDAFYEFDGFLEALKNGENYYEFNPMEDCCLCYWNTCK